MNREIKFRAYNPNWDEMVYSNLETVFDKRKFYPFGLEVGFSHYPTEGWTIMQYTGLKDKNGKEIYEGDIIQEKQGSSFIVKFGEFIIIEYDERQYGYYAEEIAKKENEIGLTGKFPIFKWGCAQSNIIGNIYENPELLEVDDEPENCKL